MRVTIHFHNCPPESYDGDTLLPRPVIVDYPRLPAEIRYTPARLLKAYQSVVVYSRVTPANEFVVGLVSRVEIIEEPNP